MLVSAVRQRRGLRFGSWPALLLSGPRDLETVLVKNAERFKKNTFFWRHVTAIFGRGLLTSEGEFWQRQRRLAAPAFAGQRLESYGDIMVRHTSRVMELGEPDAARDFHADMMGLTVGVAAKTLLTPKSKRTWAIMDEAMNTLTDQIAVRFARPFVIPDAVPLPGHIRYRRALRRVDGVFQRIIRERQSDGQDKGDLLSRLMQARDENGDPMPDRQLRDEAVTLLLAGHETTALALSWTVYLLGQHRDVRCKSQPKSQRSWAPERPRSRTYLACASRIRSSPKQCASIHPPGPSGGKPLRIVKSAATLFLLDNHFD